MAEQDATTGTYKGMLAREIINNIERTKSVSDKDLRLFNLKADIRYDLAGVSAGHQKDPVYKKFGDMWCYYSGNILKKYLGTKEGKKHYEEMSNWIDHASKAIILRMMPEKLYNFILNSPVEKIVNKILGINQNKKESKEGLLSKIF